ncbi:MAG: HAD-IB family phosphatase [Candidatus Sericytochromatia bacterium]|nr:HAD-IB family phosphatase [Candidatus Sericytochromatia bacterium]
MPAVTILCDFDGTITLRDTNDALVAHFVGAERRVAFDRLVRDGGRPLWEVLDMALEACQVPLEEALVHLHRHVPFDPHFVPFSAWCATRGWPLRIVSAGLGEVIGALLAREGLDLPVAANRARRSPRGFGLEPVDPSCPTGVDKAAIVRAVQAEGGFTVFIGDGLSDRLAAPHADLVFAKAGLSQWCRQQGIDHVPFARFDAVQAHLEQHLTDV